MILREATIKYSGRNPDLLPPKSNYRICCNCDGCGRVRWCNYQAYRSLCKSCVRIGKSNGCKGKHHSEETKLKISNSCKGKFKGKNNPNYKGGNIIVICKQCKNEYSTKQCNKLITKFCSKECHNKWMSINQIGKESPHWKGGLNRDHVKHERDCIKLNERFFGSEMHHIMSRVVIYIPKYIHRSIYHNMKSGQGINEINKLAFNFLIGDKK